MFSPAARRLGLSLVPSSEGDDGTAVNSTSTALALDVAEKFEVIFCVLRLCDNKTCIFA